MNDASFQTKFEIKNLECLSLFFFVIFTQRKRKRQEKPEK